MLTIGLEPIFLLRKEILSLSCLPFHQVSFIIKTYILSNREIESLTQRFSVFCSTAELIRHLSANNEIRTHIISLEGK